MVAWGKDKSESRVTAEFYNCAVEVMRGAEAIDAYTALPLQEAFDIEYWLLEEAKLQRMPPEQELARQIIAVVGGGSGIGREAALRLAKEGAHIVCVDRDEAGARTRAAGQPGADDLGERGGGEEGQPGLRHQQSSGEPPGARAGNRAGPAGARERRGASDRGRGQRDVPTRPGDRLAGEVPDR